MFEASTDNNTKNKTGVEVGEYPKALDEMVVDPLKVYLADIQTKLLVLSKMERPTLEEVATIERDIRSMKTLYERATTSFDSILKSSKERSNLH